MITRDEISKAIFGSFDGMTCVLGIIAAMSLSGDIRALILSCLALAIGEGVSMSGGSYLSEVTAVGGFKHAAITGISAFLGVMLPALPFFFCSGMLAIALCFIIIIMLAIVIAQARISSGGWIKSYVQTFAILLIAASASILITLAINKMGVSG